MGAITSQRIRVPSKKSLEFFMANWNKIQLPVVNGQVTVPEPGKVMGPKSREAIDEYVKGDIRFMPRCVRVRPPGGKDKDVFDSIITWDLVHRPKQNDAFDQRIADEKKKMRKEENDKDKLTEMIKKGKLK